MVSMLLCSTRSDLFPTRINGTLQQNLSLPTDISTTESSDLINTFSAKCHIVVLGILKGEVEIVTLTK